MRLLFWRCICFVGLRFPRIYRFLYVGRSNAVVIGESDAISMSETFPLFFFSGKIRKRFGAKLFLFPATAFLRGESPAVVPKVVILQLWFNVGERVIYEACLRSREKWPGAKIVFLDAFAPTDLRFAAALDSVVDLYLKKNVLSDRSEYGLPTNGDTNLSNWYGSRYCLVQTPKTFTVTETFKRKLKPYPGFFMAPYLLKIFLGKTHLGKAEKKYDLHARLGGIGRGDWYQLMRNEAASTVQSLSLAEFRITPTGGLPRSQYLEEMSESLVCFSPFGYGEICWRDFEAVAYGAVLVKPDVSHLQIEPAFFKPWITYVPIAWDFSDLKHVMHVLSSNPGLCREIATNAFEVLAAYVKGDGFVELAGEILS